MTSRGGEVDRHIHAAGSYQVSAGQRGNSDHPRRQAVFHQASPSRGGGTDLQGRAAGAFQAGSSPWQAVYLVKAVWGVFPRKQSYHLGRQSVFHQARPSRGGEVDQKIHAAGSYQVSAGQGGKPNHPGRGLSADSTPAVFRTRSGRGGEVDRLAGAAGSFRACGSPWQ